MDPAGMAHECLEVGGRLAFLQLPELNATVKTTTGEYPPIGTPDN
jgi:hypothetical protein